MTSTATPSSDAIELPQATTAPATTAASSASSSTLSFASLLSPSTSSLGGTIGSTGHPSHISPMVPSTSSAAASANGSQPAAALPFDVRAFVENIKQRQLHRRLRPASAFFNPARFSRPQSTAEATARVELNLQWFWVNYLAIAALILVLTILSQPSFLLTLIVLAAVWFFAMTRETIAVPFTPYSLSGRPKLLTLYGLTAVMLFLFAGSAILTVVGICGLVVLAHAALHATPSQDERDADEQMQLDSVNLV